MARIDRAASLANTLGVPFDAESWRRSSTRVPEFSHTTRTPETVAVEVQTPETVRLTFAVTTATAERLLRAFAPDGADPRCAYCGYAHESPNICASRPDGNRAGRRDVCGLCGGATCKHTVPR